MLFLNLSVRGFPAAWVGGRAGGHIRGRVFENADDQGDGSVPCSLLFITLVPDAVSSSTVQMRRTLISALVDDSTTALRHIKNVDYVP